MWHMGGRGSVPRKENVGLKENAYVSPRRLRQSPNAHLPHLGQFLSIFAVNQVLQAEVRDRKGLLTDPAKSQSRML